MPTPRVVHGVDLRMWTVAVVVTLAWGALSFGAVYPWAYWPLNVGAITVGLHGWRVSRGSKACGPGRALCIVLTLMALAAALQVVPLSPGLLSRLSPAGDAFFGAGSALDVRQTLSIDPRSTIVALVWLLALSALFIGSARALRVVGVISLTRGIIALGVLLALLGIIGSSTSSGEIYGFWKPRYAAGPFGPFVNENHFAGWMLMALPLAIGYLCANIATGIRSAPPDWRTRLLWLSSAAANELALVALAVTLMGGALVLTLSRSGLTCLAVALLWLGWFAIRKQEGGMRRLWSFAWIGLVAVVAVGWVGVEAVAQEFAGAGGTMDSRLSAWGDALRLVRDFPVTGTGLDTYGTATLLYESDVTLRFVQAHNDYLQLAAEGGVLIGLPALLAAGLFLREVRRRFRAGEDDPTTLWVRIGAVTGLAAIALQESVEFSLRVPANAALLALLAAIAVHRPATATRVDVPEVNAARETHRRTLRPEVDLLLLCARLSLGGGQRDRLNCLLGRQPDWPSLLRLAARHRLSPLLYRHLSTARATPVPKHAVAQLWSGYEATFNRNQAKTAELLTILRLLETNGIPAIPFKGPVLAAAVYGNVALRKFNDLDLLVQPRNVLPAKELLLGVGYQPICRLAPVAEAAVMRASSQYHLRIDRGRRGTPVELHWKTHPDFPVGRTDDDHWWAGAATVSIGDATIRTFSPEELLLVLCIHGAQHRWSSLHWLVDVSELLRQTPRMDWTSVLAMAAELTCERRLGLGLRLAHDLLAAPVPEGVRRATRTQAGIDRLAVAARERLFLDHDVQPGPVTRLRFQSQVNDRWFQTFGHALRAALSPSLIEWSRWPLWRACGFLYAPLRAVRLVTKYGGRYLRMLYTHLALQCDQMRCERTHLRRRHEWSRL